MRRCQNSVTFTGQAPEQQQSQQQISVEEQPCSFPRSTMSASDDRNVVTSHSSNEAQLPRKCKLCDYGATARTEYIDHMITHCIVKKSSYVKDNFNGYVDDEVSDDSGNEYSKGKKRNKVSKQCNKCGSMATTKLQHWLHLRQHFVQEEYSGFVCVLCPFATTLKHHMKFHWFSAHDDFKGFECTECSYACVSKSMLTSHMKTHSEVYQYNCGNCTYKTKFCNTMKKHLKDNNHKAGMVLNPDGTPNPFATIDVYGSKRGPRRKPFIEEKVLTGTVQDMPSTSRMTPAISSIPISSASVLLTPILDLSDSNVALLSPVRVSTERSSAQISPVQRSSVRMSTPIPSDSDTLAATTWLNNFIKKMNSEEEVNPSINGQPSISKDNLFNLISIILIRSIASRDKVDEKEERQVCRLLTSAYRYLLGNQEHINGATSMAGAVSNDAISIDEPSTFTLISEPQPKEDEILDQPLNLSIFAMSKGENQR